MDASGRLWKAEAVRLAFFAAVIVACSPATFAEDSLARARLELEKGRADVAIPLLEDYRREHPGVAEVYSLLGMAYARQGKSDPSLAMFEAFARLEPNQPEAFNNLGASYLEHGDVANAEKSFRHALALSENDLNALYNLGVLLNGRHDYKAAHPLLTRALRRQRTHAIVYELAVSTAGLGERKQALRLLTSMSPPAGKDAVPWLRLLGTLSLDEGRLDESADAFQRVLALEPQDRLSLYSLGLARLRSNHATEAIPLLEASFASAPPAERYAKVGELLSDHRADAEAVAELEKALAEDPGSFEAYFDLASLHLRRNELEAAAEAAERAFALRQSAAAHNLLGNVLEAQGHYGKALEHLQEAVRLEPYNEAFIYDLGLELILHQNYEEARTLLRPAHERFPRSARIALGLGTAEFMAGEYDHAVTEFLKAVDLDPRYEPAFTFLGEVYYFSGARGGEVAAKLAQVARDNPQSFAAQFYWGAARVKEMERTGSKESTESARKALRRATALKPDDARTYYYLGEIEWLEGRIPEASRWYEKAVELDPGLPEALYKLARAYAKLGREDDSARLSARYREAESHRKERMYERMSQIQKFVLQTRR